MANPRTIRRLAFQVLYQLDAVRAAEALALAQAIAQDEGFTAAEATRAAALATEAFAHRARADAAVAEFAPEWPAHRQPAVDRAILRLAHYEMTSGRTPPKAAISEAVRLAKAYSTERSPAFINAILDKLLKRLPPPAAEPIVDTAVDPADEPEDDTVVDTASAHGAGDASVGPHDGDQ
jgi:N utilization substance protein B